MWGLKLGKSYERPKPKTKSESRIKRAKLGDLRLICHIVRFWSGVGGEMGASALVEKPSALASRATMSSAVDPPQSVRVPRLDLSQEGDLVARRSWCRERNEPSSLLFLPDRIHSAATSRLRHGRVAQARTCPGGTCPERSPSRCLSSCLRFWAGCGSAGPSKSAVEWLFA